MGNILKTAGELALLGSMIFALAGCSAKEATVSSTAKEEVIASKDFVEITIGSRPKHGSAHKTVSADGSISGAHLSGSKAAPRIYQSTGQVTAEDMKKLKILVAKLKPELFIDVTIPQKEEISFKTVSIIIDENTKIETYAGWEDGFESQAMQSIWDTIAKYEVGAW